MKRRLGAWVLAVVAAISAGLVTLPQPASAASPLSVPGGEWTFGCGNAEVRLQVTWGTDSATLRYRLHDKAADGRSPVLKIAGVAAGGSKVSYVFENGTVVYSRTAGEGYGPWYGKNNWNPRGLSSVNHLNVKISNGTSGEGTLCSKQANIYNWSRLAYKVAQTREGAPYQRGGNGPAYDCSGLVKTSYESISGFPGWTERVSDDMYDWVRTHSGRSKFYAEQVPFSEMKVGDLIFYNTVPGNAQYIDHVAFYAGNGRIFDAQIEGVPVGYHNDYTGSRVAAYRIHGAVMF